MIPRACPGLGWLRRLKPSQPFFFVFFLGLHTAHILSVKASFWWVSFQWNASCIVSYCPRGTTEKARYYFRPLLFLYLLSTALLQVTTVYNVFCWFFHGQLHLNIIQCFSNGFCNNITYGWRFCFLQLQTLIYVHIGSLTPVRTPPNLHLIQFAIWPVTIPFFITALYVRSNVKDSLKIL